MAEATILYDADCGVCRWLLAKLLAWDRRGRLRPVALQDPEADLLLPAMSEEERMASWHLVSRRRDLRSAGAAVPELLRLLPGGRPLAAIAQRTPGLNERGYRWVADHRSQLGRLVGAGARRRADERIRVRASRR